MSHTHSHGTAHGHSHGATSAADGRRLTIALALILGLMVVEIAVGVIAHALVLLSDAGHMLTDAAALGFSLLALRLAARPARGALTFGLGRAEILSAQANGITLIVLAALIVYAAIGRLITPQGVQAVPIIVVALVGIAVNAVATSVLAGGARQSLNIEGSFQHLLTDLYAFIGTLIAGVIILVTGFERADAIASLFVAALMLRSGVGLIRASGRVFLEASPVDLSPAEIGTALAHVPGVVEVHDLHVWEVTSGFPALSAHVLVAADVDCHATRRGLEQMLTDRFDLHHTTLQVDHEPRELLELEVAPAARRAPDDEPRVSRGAATDRPR